MNPTQIQNAAAPIIAAIAAYLASNHILFDSATWNVLIGGGITFGATIWLAIANRKKALVNTVGNMPDTTVVTDKKTADSLPANSSVVSNTVATVVPK